MSSPPVKLIATDLDGTLLRSDGSVSPRVRRSLLAAQDAGMEIVPATGRPRLVTDDVIAQLDFVHHWIFANGSVTWHLGRSELIRGFWLVPTLARDLVVELRRSLPNAGFALEFEDTVAFEPGFEDVVPRVPDVRPSVDVAELIDRRVQKVLVFDHDRSIDELFRAVTAVVGHRAVPSYSGLPFIELAASLVTKATALELLADDLGLARAEVAAFGDNHNDIAMLNWAGRSYAMANATPDAKEAAGVVIGFNDEDAVGHQIDELVAEAGAG